MLAFNEIYHKLKNNKNKICLSFASLILVVCTWYYLYIPKMSDVERYKANNDVVAMCNLVDKAISFDAENHKYEAVRNQAIRALAEMNTAEGNKCLEKYLYSDDRKVDSALKKEIFKALLVKHDKFLNEFVDARLQKSSKEKTVLYDELLYVTRDKGASDNRFKNNDFVERKIAMDIVSNMKNSVMDNYYIDLIKNFDCAKPGSNKDIFRYLLSSYINIYNELDDFDNKKTKEIDKKIVDAVEERKRIAFYLQNADEFTGNMIREIYITQGVNKALEYTNQVAKNTVDQVNRYWQLESELKKLNYEKKNLIQTKYNLQNKQELYYQKLKEYISDTPEKFAEKNRYIGEIAKGLAGSSANLPSDLLGLNWNNPSAYISKLKFELRSDGGLLVYRDNNANVVPLRLADCLPDSINVVSSRFVISKDSRKIISVELNCSSNDWKTIHKYLTNKYGSSSSPLDEDSTSIYRAVWLSDDKAIDLIYYKEGSKLRLTCHDKSYLFSN